MTDQNHVYKLVELVGTSPVGVDDAIRNAIEQASQSLRHLDWFETTEIRGHIADGKIAHFQVKLKVGFRFES
ncbi:MULTISPECIES: dodecin [Aromatoleum]|uniref:Dodecin flavoprotein n=2 Tax=Aromatoleum TaxID=551759 RepID=A0ABX1NWB7_9RHOO|nr:MULTISPECIES: dodecin [Aromatoleum]MCK0505829.1 dodecin family protein [Aromatoleum anaerobium]NMG16319.1 dodecin flavoprotein [Aromatoleum bremense]QTQ33620.1 Putative dodecin flavoprotein [Aromatoleum bremense]